MPFVRRAVAFVLTFAMLACTMTVMSSALIDPTVNETLAASEYADATAVSAPIRSGKALADTGAAAYKPRLSAPALTNKYYYSDINIFYKHGYGMPNCTAYAYGRAYELLGQEPQLCIYSAYLWYDYNKDNQCYAYGQTPKQGAIACWTYTWGSSGHVAVVEKVEDNTITFSNSAYGGETFYLSTAPVTDPSGGNTGWIFQGYIYPGEKYVPGKNEDAPSAQGDVYRVTSQDGVYLRSGAGTSYPSLGSILYGQSATVTKTKKADNYTWGYTTYAGMSGWFALDFAKLIYKKTENKPSAPTEAETVKPTQAPTAKPMQAPTAKPTQAPSSSATKTKATEKPTAAPTEKPTAKPEVTIEQIKSKAGTTAVKTRSAGQDGEAEITAPSLRKTVSAEDATECYTALRKTRSAGRDYLPSVAPTGSDRAPYLMGDVDGDGKITMDDAQYLRYVLAQIIIPTEYMLIVGDCNGDSELTIYDAVKIADYVRLNTAKK